MVGGSEPTLCCRAALLTEPAVGFSEPVLLSRTVRSPLHARVIGFVYVMAGRRLEDRIRELCAKAATARDAETVQVLQELRDALHEHARHLRAMAAEKLTGGARASGEDRRRKR